MSWIKKKIMGIKTPTNEKKQIPDGLWFKTPSGNIMHIKDLVKNAYVCPSDNYHISISSEKYFSILFDAGKYEELNADMASRDPLSFIDTKSYHERLQNAQVKTGLKDAIRTAIGHLDEEEVLIGCMDFDFIGGSMGSLVGQKISLSIELCIKKQCPLILISKSGGARMQEGAFSLMQMAKTVGKLTLLNQHKIPFFSVMANPCYGGVTASFAMMGDFNIAEPQAAIGFAGPRVIKETVRKELPRNFQKAESLFQHGFIDSIIDRRHLKSHIATLIKMLKPNIVF